MKNRNLMKMAGILLLALLPLMGHAQYMTEVFLTDCPPAIQKEVAQQNIGKLLTLCNVASADNMSLDLTGIEIDSTAITTLNSLWAVTPFRCGDTEVIQACLVTSDKNYQIRNVPLYLKNNEEGEDYQEAVVCFNAAGRIVDFHLAIASNLYVKVLKKGYDVSDLRYRQMILDYVEQFRTAYNTKDMPFLEQIYSEDALIITGKVVKSVPTEANNFMGKAEVVYNKQTKREYLDRLAKVFAANKRIHVAFDDIKVMKHPAKAGYYGVTLKQGYSSDRYSDSGYLFLLWDFTNPDAPQIHVRTWQPEMLDANTKLPEEKIFTCEDFDIK